MLRMYYICIGVCALWRSKQLGEVVQDGHLPSEASDASCAPTEIANTVWCFCGGGETIFGSACGCGGRASFASVGDTSLFGDNASCVSPEKRACTCPCHQEPATRPPATDGALWECDCNCAELAEPANITTAHVARAVYRGGYEGVLSLHHSLPSSDDLVPMLAACIQLHCAS